MVGVQSVGAPVNGTAIRGDTSCGAGGAAVVAEPVSSVAGRVDGDDEVAQTG